MKSVASDTRIASASASRRNTPFFLACIIHFYLLPIQLVASCTVHTNSRDLTDMLLLYGLAGQIKAKRHSEDRLAHMTGIDRAKLHKIIYPSQKTECWFDEAVALSRALGCAGIMPLLGVGALSEARGMPQTLPNDLDMLRAGVRLPIGLAVNIALKLGLSDPVELVVSPLTRELWQIISVERNATCPWCHATTNGGPFDHETTCLPDTLWGERGLIEIAVPPRPQRKGQGGGTMYGKGLRALRERMRLTQAQMAGRCNVDANGYAQLERCTRPLTTAMASRFAQATGIKREVFYLDPAASL